MATNVPKPSFGPLGFTAPSQADILAGVIADINAAFGGGVNPSLETPQGQLASSMTAIIGNAYDAFIYLANQMDPTYASGRMQDAIGQIYFQRRNPSEPTVVTTTCGGGAGVFIPAGSLALADDGSLYASLDDATIGVGGTVSVQFACTLPGPTTCPAGSLDTIYQAIPGWNTITNPTDGVIGRDAESRTQFEERRRASVAANSSGALPSVLGAVLAVPGVLDAFATENVLTTPLTIGGYTLKPKSLYVAAVGGSAADVAKAIWSKKAPGCDYNGNQAVTVLDQNPAYSAPFPAYPVLYQIPANLPTVFNVYLTNNALVPANAGTLIQNAILNAFAGGDGGPRARIGGTVLASRFYAAVAALGTWTQLIKITIGSANNANAKFTASIAAGVMTVTAVASGALAVGQTVTDAAGSILPGTKISSLGTGTGGVGTYNLSKPQAVSSRALASTAAAGDSVTTQIDQVPTAAADNITVVLQ